jgi:hypothetical protein
MAGARWLVKGCARSLGVSAPCRRVKESLIAAECLDADN